MSGEAETEAPTGRRVTRRSLLTTALATTATALVASPAEAMRVPRERELHIVNAHTGESFRDVFWANGRHVNVACRRLNWLMRDFRTDTVKPIDSDLVDLLYGIQTRIGRGKPLVLLSGYRTQETNQMLIAEGHGAVENSMHTVGRAADISIQGVQLRYLSRAAVSFRAGGVGTYWHNNFVHVDTGRIRFW